MTTMQRPYTGERHFFLSPGLVSRENNNDKKYVSMYNAAINRPWSVRSRTGAAHRVYF